MYHCSPKKNCHRLGMVGIQSRCCVCVCCCRLHRLVFVSWASSHRDVVVDDVDEENNDDVVQPSSSSSPSSSSRMRTLLARASNRTWRRRRVSLLLPFAEDVEDSEKVPVRTGTAGTESTTDGYNVADDEEESVDVPAFLRIDLVESRGSGGTASTDNIRRDGCDKEELKKLEEEGSCCAIPF